MTKHPVTMLDLPGAQAAQRERTFLLQPIEQWKEPFATALVEANDHERHNNPKP